MESLRRFVQPGQSVREFTEPQNTVGQAIWQTRRGFSQRQVNMIDNLFGGHTSEEDEDRALAIILSAEKAEELIFLINHLTWDGLDDDLDEADLDRIALRLSNLLDSRDYRVNAILQRAFLSDAAALRDKSDNELRAIAATIPFEIRQEQADEIVDNRDNFLNGVALTALRGLPTNIREFKLLIDFIQNTGQHRPAQLSQMAWELFYTERICSQLERGECRSLLQTLPELVDPLLPAARRVAFFDMLRRLDREFAAMEELVKAVGSVRQQSDMRKFMDTRRLFMDNFPAQPQQPNAIQQAIQAILNAINGVAGGFQDLASAVQAIAQTIEDLSVPDVFGTSSDDIAVNATNGLFGQNLLALLPSDYKLELINRMLSGAAEDEEEQGTLKILQESKKRSVAEFLQLVVGETWEKLDSNLDGQEHDDLEGLFVF